MNLRLLLSAGLVAVALAASAMTDDEVITYIRAQSAAGKSNSDISKELIANGVSQAQIRRIRSKYNREGSVTTGTQVEAQTAALSDDGRDAPPETAYQNSGLVVDVFAPDRGEAAREVYGHDLFNTSNLTFAPNKNMATPRNYRLGPGDEVIIDMWGDAEEHLRQTISPEGSIMISRLGPVHLNGKTIEEANQYVRNLFASKYAGVSTDQTDISVNLGDVRSINIDIMGEVDRPGSFQISPFSTVFHALYNAGGINNIGSMRNITVLRNGRRIANVDIYDYLFNGKQSGNIRLQEGDVIIVPPYEQIVNISGNVKRPMYYEIKPGETVASLIEYAGGFAGDAYSGMVRLSRQNGEDNDLYNIDKGEFASYRLQDGDVITVGNVLDRYSNRVELKGAVNRPGLYALGSKATTLRELIGLADGLTDDAYRGRAFIYREGPDLSLEVIPFDLGAVMSGYEPDITLQKNDIIDISSSQLIEEKGDFTISGMVAHPGPYSYIANTTVEDLILRAGGLLEGASAVRVEIARRINDPLAVTESPQLADIFTVNIAGGLQAKRDRGSEFLLKPYDQVTVRKSPTYSTQRSVSIDGEIVFPGSYTLYKRNERLSDLVQRAGGIVDGAYVKGAYLKRRMTDDEYQERQNVIRMAMYNQATNDSISTSKLDISYDYNVGINLPYALAHPGSVQDLVLQPGDRLFIPEQQSTVKVSGDVMLPNTTIYQPGEKVSYYINQAGGYGQQAKKNKAFIIYMNGMVAKVGRNTVVEPGSHIIVPSKPEKNNQFWERVIPLISGLGSVATMAAAVASMVKK